MRVRVLFFGMIRDVAGRTADTLELREGATVSEVLKQFCTSMNRFSDYEKSVALAVNREYVSTDTVLKDGDELAVLPPVSGGSGEEAPEKAQFGAEIVHDRIDSKRIVNALSHRDVGAILVFEGVVRGNTRGRRTLYLDYEAYEPMALKELKRLQAQAKEKFAITEAAIVHRLGRLQVGETSVLIVVSSVHRAAGFDACRWIIDTLKKAVPIWKKEYFEDGAVWADGDPFPEELRPRPVDPVDEGA